MYNNEILAKKVAKQQFFPSHSFLSPIFYVFVSFFFFFLFTFPPLPLPFGSSRARASLPLY